MDRKRLNRKSNISTRAGFVAAAGLLCLSSGTAWAAGGQSVCLNNRTGQIVAKRRCTKSETMLDAAAVAALSTEEADMELATAVQGARGAQGGRGQIGPRGPQGPQGPQGLQGPKGDKGDKGDAGLQGAMGPQGLAGAQGATGAQGPQGEQGPVGVSGYEVLTSETIVQPGTIQGVMLACTAGKTAIGGGGKPVDSFKTMMIAATYPETRSSWHVTFNNTGSANARAKFYVICASMN